MADVTKSRNLSGEDYYDIVQLEWITWQVRHLIYDRPEDKEKYKKWAEGKKEKINEYSEKNGIKSIFNSPEIRDFYVGRFFNESGLPNFQYRSEDQRNQLSKWDKFHYFCKGLEVEVEGDLVTIYWNLLDENSVEVIENGKVKICPYNQIKRNFKKELLKTIQ
jgi:hypothetical protein